MPSADPTSSLPHQRLAIVAESAGKLQIKRDMAMPTLAPDTVLVKTAAVAINPSDAKFLDYSPAPGAVHGTDFSGTVRLCSRTRSARRADPAAPEAASTR